MITGADRHLEGAKLDVVKIDGANKKPKDTLTKAGALRLARQLEKHWHDLGYPAARFWTQPVEERFAKVGTDEIYPVRSNLVNGLPPRYRD